MLLAHMDTARSTKDVRPVFLEDRITSDGTTALGVDDRLGVAAILYAVKTAIEQNIVIRPFTMAFTTCEETTLLGSKNLRLDKAITSGFVFDSYLPIGHFISQSSGAATVNVKINGNAAHSDILPEKRVNAIQIAVEALSNAPFGRISPNTTVDIGMVSSNAAANVVTDYIEMRGEICSTQLAVIEEQVEKVKQAFIDAAKKYGGAVECEITWNFKPYKIASNDEPYKRIVEVFESIRLEPKTEISWGGSDANSLNASGIATVNLGIGAQNPHSNEEFILLKDIENLARIALGLIKA